MNDMSVTSAFRLLSLFTNNKWVDYRTIMDAFEEDDKPVSRETAYRYLRRIWENLPVESVDGRSKRYRLRSGYRVPEVSSGDEKGLAFVAALLDLAKRNLDVEHAEQIEELKQKMFSGLHYSSYAVLAGESEDYKKVAKNITLLERCIAERRAVTIDYARNGKSYKLYPYKILFDNGLWYLLAENESRLKTFRIDSIVNAKSARKHFEVNYKKLDAFLNRGNIWQRDEFKPDKITMLFNEEIAHHFNDRQILPAQRIVKAHKDGSLEIEFEATNEIEFKLLVMPWFPEFTIISPKKYKDYIDKLIKDYA
ncbi:YafY family protein [Deferribacterales bacterium RsTz2092]|nr:transcriptional regulator [Deferribacterales bacterium]